MKEQALWNLMNLFCKAHPWHGVTIGEEAPEKIHCYIEIAPTDTVKFELDKRTGLLKIDRPQQFSNFCPCLYGLIPRTHCGKRVGQYCAKKTNRKEIYGDDDPLDVCVITEKAILRGDILVTAMPIGGIRAIDGDRADDKIIAILADDPVFASCKDITDCPKNIIDRLKHYFLTYKDHPDVIGKTLKRKMEITHIYDREEALEVIRIAQADYDEHFSGIQDLLRITLSEE